MLKKDIRNTKFSKISISLASPDYVLDNSRGEVLRPETINYRTHKPERDGLFCERIFGPVKNYECACSKFKRIRYKGIVCDSCGVEVTEKKVRRDRMGHINLMIPVVHIWYFKTLPNKMAHLLGISSKDVDKIVYYEKYVVVQPGIAKDKSGNKLETHQLLTEEEYFDVIDDLPEDNETLEDSNPDKFIAKMGGEALRDILQRIDINNLYYDLRHRANTQTTKQKKLDALKRLKIVKVFRDSVNRGMNKLDWMVITTLPVIPPELRPLVPLDGGRFATSDLNEFYRRIIIRNNRLRKLIEIKAPDVILRNEKRMLQESVDSLFDNSRNVYNSGSEYNKVLKSLSDSLKGKQGRFRQNLLGKRVDYSGRSVIVVGPELNLHECGIPKEMAAELYNPYIISHLIKRGIVKTVKSAKKIIEDRDPVIWDILENVLKGHPVLLNRAPTLHRLGIQAFQPKLVEGKAIRLHPLVCTAFNADFDGDQMAVHLPLTSSAILEAQILMLSSHNILNPANGSPIAVPSQDMILGLYYMTNKRVSTKDKKVKGEGKVFYSPQEVLIAYNEKMLDIHAQIKVLVTNVNDSKELVDTTVGRVIFNSVVPEGVGFINEVISRKNLKNIISNILQKTSIKVLSDFLDKIKDMGYYHAFKGGLSFNLLNVIVPDSKIKLIDEANKEINSIWDNYNFGLITNNERYNQIIDVWTNAIIKLTDIAMFQLEKDDQGFNPVYMMLDSGARGSKEQIRQLSAMRGLMAKPQKSSISSEIIENPIIANFKEGLSILEFFISTHGARKGLADTALKTADAGYLTRRLVNVAQDVVIRINDCNTIRGLKMSALKRNEEIIEPLGDRIIGRIALNDVYSLKDELIVAAGEEIDEQVVRKIQDNEIEEVDVRSSLTCDSKRGICAKCYGRDLSNNRIASIGSPVGVVAAQSIGEPGTQLTLRTFHIGGTAVNVAEEYKTESKGEGAIKIQDLKFVVNKEGKKIVVSRYTDFKILENETNKIIMKGNIPYGAELLVDNEQRLKKNEVICTWDPYNAVIVSEKKGKIKYNNLEQGLTYKLFVDEQTGFKEKVVIESKNKNLIPTISIVDKNEESLKSYNLPLGSHISVEDDQDINLGDIVVKIPRNFVKAGDITGGLPRVTELFEARNPSNPAVVSEIEGIVSYGKIKRGSREIIVESKSGKIKKYLVKLSNQILVQENDYVKAGTPLSEGAITPSDILNIEGATKVQEYLVNEMQEVYRLQGVKINDKHFEIIVRQMTRKVKLVDNGDSDLIIDDIIHRDDFIKTNNYLYNKKVVIDSGDSTDIKKGQIVSIIELRDENSKLKRLDKKLVKTRDAIMATAKPILQGITKSSLETNSFISTSSFQETTRVLSEASIAGKVDYLEGLKENVIIGGLIPAGTGLRDYDDMIVGSADEYKEMVSLSDN